MAQDNFTQICNVLTNLCILGLVITVPILAIDLLESLEDWIKRTVKHITEREPRFVSSKPIEPKE